LAEGEPISDLCDEQGLQPTVFYRWQKEFFENSREDGPTITRTETNRVSGEEDPDEG
jgi:transposase-like protein